MKMHSNTLTTSDVQDAALIARAYDQDVFVEEMLTCGSRTRQQGVVFYLESNNGRRATNRNRGNEMRAASWSAWGYVIAELFNRDPDAIIGNYKGAADFRAQCEHDREHRENLDGKQALDFLKTLNGDKVEA